MRINFTWKNILKSIGMLGSFHHLKPVNLVWIYSQKKPRKYPFTKAWRLNQTFLSLIDILHYWSRTVFEILNEIIIFIKGYYRNISSSKARVYPSSIYLGFQQYHSDQNKTKINPNKAWMWRGLVGQSRCPLTELFSIPRWWVLTKPVEYNTHNHVDSPAEVPTPYSAPSWLQ